MQVLDRVAGQVDIDRAIVAGVLAGVGRVVTGERLGARAVVGRRLAGLDAVLVLAIFEADGDIQRRGHAHVEGPYEVQVGGPFAGLELAVIEVPLRNDRRRRHRGQHREELGVGGVLRIDLVGVLAVGAGQVPGPAAELALDPGGEGVVVLGQGFGRVEPGGQGIIGHPRGGDPLDLAGHAVVLIRVRVAMAVAAGGVEFEAAAEVVAGVEEGIVDIVVGVAVDVVHIGRAGLL